MVANDGELQKQDERYKVKDARAMEKEGLREDVNTRERDLSRQRWQVAVGRIKVGSYLGRVDATFIN
jgi:ribosomal protein L29